MKDKLPKLSFTQKWQLKREMGRILSHHNEPCAAEDTQPTDDPAEFYDQDKYSAQPPSPMGVSSYIETQPMSPDSPEAAKQSRVRRFIGSMMIAASMNPFMFRFWGRGDQK